jgi:dethiobiotin synthetase
MKKGYFITGTDTGVGKTFVSCTLLQAFADKGERIGAMKPIAAGCEKTPDGWQNDDALQLCDTPTSNSAINWLTQSRSRHR